MSAEKVIHWILGLGLVIIGGGTIMFGDSGHWPGIFTLQKTIMSGTIWGGMMGVALGLMIATEKALEALAARVVGANWWMHFDQSQTPDVVDGFEAWELGGCLPRKFPIHIPGNKGTLIVPPDSTDWAGDNLVVNAVVVKTPDDEMQPGLLAGLKAVGKKGPWFMAVFPAVVHMRAHAVNQKMHEVQLASIKANKAEAMVRELMKGGRMIDAHWQKRIEAATKPKPIRRFFSGLIDGNNGDQAPPSEEAPR